MGTLLQCLLRGIVLLVCCLSCSQSAKVPNTIAGLEYQGSQGIQPQWNAKDINENRASCTSDDECDDDEFCGDSGRCMAIVWLQELVYGTWTQESSSQCYVDEIEYDDDDLDNPIIGGESVASDWTLEECQDYCTSGVTDDYGRACVAVEHGSHDPDDEASCGLAWGCDYVSDWSTGDTYIMDHRYYLER